jgi:SAM-dependent methyltransferase
MPGQRKQKFGDLDYDLEHGVDTSRSNVSLRTQIAAALAGHPYFATEPWIFEEMIAALPAQRHQFTFVDVGSGKGRVLLLAAAHGFRGVMGVEFLPQLDRIAKQNIAKFVADRPDAGSIKSFCLDARDFSFPQEPLVVYLFNPFPEDAFVEVLENLKRSIDRHPRPLWIAYRFPEFETLLKRSQWLEKVAGTGQWTVYSNCPDRDVNDPIERDQTPPL